MTPRPLGMGGLDSRTFCTTSRPAGGPSEQPESSLRLPSSR